MNIGGKSYQTIWLDPENEQRIYSIDQRKLPFELVVEPLTSLDEVCSAIRDMHLRGAPLIGVAAAFGLYLAALQFREDREFKRRIEESARKLLDTRPTAVNLKTALDRQLGVISSISDPGSAVRALREGARILLEEERESCRRIGEHGLDIIRKISAEKQGDVVNILTHCNAGWLACVDYGTATAPIYLAHDSGIDLHVWVDETRPRNQGARLTAWELGQHGVKHTLIPDNAGGLLMLKGQVDLVLVGSDRTTRKGDVANKIGTYLKAIAAYESKIPFYVALPSTTIDWDLSDGIREIPIEVRDPDEVHFVDGMSDQTWRSVRISPRESQAVNFGFDITPARYVTGLITERGICPATEEGLRSLFSRTGKI